MESVTNSPTVLITGINSFTGRYLKLELESFGYDVFGTSTKNSSDDHVFFLNFLDRIEVEAFFARKSFDYVVHLAAVSFVESKDVQEIYNVNVCGTVNLLVGLMNSRSTIKKVFLISSSVVFGNQPSVLLNESSKFYPLSDYALSKVSVEYLANMYSEDLPIIILRPFNYTGRGQNNIFLIPKIIENFKLRRNVIELGNLDVSRDYSDVRDIARFYARLVGVAKPGEVYNVGSGSSYSIFDILTLLGTITGHEPEIRSLKENQRKKDIISVNGDFSKINEILNSPCRIEFKETLEWMLDC
jgi:GDP-6-deoxy-D-talose 4-dehydrogenase